MCCFPPFVFECRRISSEEAVFWTNCNRYRISIKTCELSYTLNLAINRYSSGNFLNFDTINMNIIHIVLSIALNLHQEWLVGLNLIHLNLEVNVLATIYISGSTCLCKVKNIKDSIVNSSRKILNLDLEWQNICMPLFASQFTSAKANVISNCLIRSASSGSSIYLSQQMLIGSIKLQSLRTTKDDVTLNEWNDVLCILVRSIFRRSNLFTIYGIHNCTFIQLVLICFLNLIVNIKNAINELQIECYNILCLTLFGNQLSLIAFINITISSQFSNTIASVKSNIIDSNLQMLPGNLNLTSVQILSCYCIVLWSNRCYVWDGNSIFTNRQNITRIVCHCWICLTCYSICRLRIRLCIKRYIRIVSENSKVLREIYWITVLFLKWTCNHYQSLTIHNDITCSTRNNFVVAIIHCSSTFTDYDTTSIILIYALLDIELTTLADYNIWEQSSGSGLSGDKSFLSLRCSWGILYSCITSICIQSLSSTIINERLILCVYSNRTSWDSVWTNLHVSRIIVLINIIGTISNVGNLIGCHCIAICVTRSIQHCRVAAISTIVLIIRELSAEIGLDTGFNHAISSNLGTCNLSTLIIHGNLLAIVNLWLVFYIDDSILFVNLELPFLLNVIICIITNIARIVTVIFSCQLSIIVVIAGSCIPRSDCTTTQISCSIPSQFEVISNVIITIFNCEGRSLFSGSVGVAVSLIEYIISYIYLRKILLFNGNINLQSLMIVIFYKIVVVITTYNFEIYSVGTSIFTFDVIFIFFPCGTV